MLGFVKDHLKEEIEKMEELENEEELEDREEYGDLYKAKFIVECDIRSTNIIFDLLIQIELKREKAQNNTNIFHDDKSEESDDMDTDGDEKA
jgi:hypothetical protein